MNPDGLVDGLLLSDNTVVRFPPHLSQRLVQVVKPQDAVQVDGFFESQGSFHATPPWPQKRPPAPNPYSRQPMSVSGILKKLKSLQESLALLGICEGQQFGWELDIR